MKASTPSSQYESIDFGPDERVILISDLHLEEGRPEITDAFFNLLDRIESEFTAISALFILGDFFEVWIGDDHTTPFTLSIATKLLNLAKTGLNIYFMVGNRDFLLDQPFCRAAGMQKIEEPALIRFDAASNNPASAISYGIMHGDALCTDDAEYMNFRTMVRSPQWQQQFLAKPIEERLAIAKALRERSRAHQAKLITDQADQSKLSDVTPTAVKQAFEALQVDTLIHGHTHRPNTHWNQLTQQTRIVLGDWEQHGWYCLLEGNQYSLEKFPILADQPITGPL